MNIESLFDAYEADYEDDDLDGFEQDWNPVPHNSLVLNTRVIADGATTVAEVADMLRIYADYLDGLADEGYEVFQAIQNGTGYAFLPEAETK